MRRQVIGIAVGAMIAATLAGVSAQAGAAASGGIALHSSSAKLAGTVNVASLPRATGHAAGAERQIPLRGRHGDAASASAWAAPPDGLQPLLSIAAGTNLTPALKESDNSVGLTPPDMGVGADATHVVQMVNDVGRIWTSHVAGPVFTLDSFFLAAGDFISDPWVLFDQESGRWFAGIFDVTLGGELIAISTTGSPTGSWFVYAIQYPGQPSGGCPDQGKGAVDTNVVALGFNEFAGNGCTGGFLGAAIEIFNKAQMMAGATVNFVFTNPNSAYLSEIPAQALSAGQTTEYFAGNDVNSSSKALHRQTTTGVPPATVTLTTLTDLTLAHTYPTPPGAVQKGSAKLLASGDQRMQHVVWKAGVGLLMSWTEGCKPAGDTKTRDCARVVATNDGVGGPSVTMDTDLSKNANYYFYPAATLNSSNDVVVDFGVSGSLTFPQLDAAAATVGGSFTTPIALVTGTAANATGRYGDYFAVALDPASANQNVWAAGEIGGPSSGAWQTVVREVNVTP